MMWVRKSLVGFVLIIAWLVQMQPALRGQSAPLSPSEVLTLEQAIELAVRDNLQVKNASLEVNKVDERLGSLRTERWPSLHLDVFPAEQLRPIDMILPQGVFGLYPNVGPIPGTNIDFRTPAIPTLTLVGRVSQPLSQLYRINLDVGNLKLSREVAQEKLREKQHQITQDVKQAYFAILQTQSGQQSASENIKLYRELDRVTDEYVTHGTALKADSLDIKVRLAKAEYDALTLADRLAVEEHQLNQLLGRNVLQEFSLNPAPKETEYEVDLATARGRALEQRPELREARLRIREAEGDRRVKKSEFIPDTSIRFQYYALRDFNDIIPKNIAELGVSVSWEVFDWGRKKHELNEKDLTIEQSKNDLREAETSIQIEVDDKFRKLQRTRQLLRVAQLSQQASLENVRLMTERYQVQASLLKDVLQAQTALEQANDQYQQALLSLWMAKAEFEKAIGDDK
ncbi:MAG TPA: TolC family protein [Terriglobia bacterium]|nr:TolC family protein [Terriglobia bacterium]